jgi:hypothetical protein
MLPAVWINHRECPDSNRHDQTFLSSLAARKFLKRLKATRHRLQGSGSAQVLPKVLPDQLNPVVAQSQIDPWWRPVAR